MYKDGFLILDYNLTNIITVLDCQYELMFILFYN